MPITAPELAILYNAEEQPSEKLAVIQIIQAQLRAAGVRVADEREDSDSGRFGWAYDPEGNRFELWQPPSGA